MVEEQLWIEKHRPLTLNDIVGHVDAIARLRKFAESKNSMNFLFSGPPATGKTTAALCFAHDLYGESWKRNFTEMNASDERGIDVVRGKIKDYARTAPVNATFKIIFMDEVDNLTSDAQGALRRTMEKYSSTCRFILSCNYDNKLIAPIKSRLAKFHFGGLTDVDMQTLILRIAAKENVTITPELALNIVEYSNRDAREAINALQVCSMLGTNITEEDIKKTFQVPDKRIVEQIINLAIDGDLPQSFEIMTNHIINAGFDITRVLKMISDIILTLSLDSYILAKINDSLSTADHHINCGDSVDIQMKGLLSKMLLISKMEPACLKNL